MSDKSQKTVLEMQTITKNFLNVHALDSVSFDCIKGEVHSIVGENGAGKSTLMKILTGIHQPDQGEIFLNGKKVMIPNVQTAEKLGISIVFQESSLIPYLSAMENIFLGNHPKNKFGIVQWKKIKEKAETILKNLGFSVDIRSIAENLSVADQKIIEICRALVWDRDILILDEPTATLSAEEVDKFLKMIDKLRNSGNTIIFISHRIKEIVKIADRITILKDGKKVDCFSIKEIDEDGIIQMMVGRKIKDIFPPHAKCEENNEIFRVEKLSVKTVREGVSDLSFSVYRNKIFGIGGLEGHGQRALLRALFGLEEIKSGNIYIGGKKVSIKNPRMAKRSKIALIPDDRQREGLFLIRSIRENLGISTLEQRHLWGIIDKKQESDVLKDITAQLKIKMDNFNQKVSMLSGGNMQKVVLGKWFIANPKVILLIEPTKGVDIGTKSQIYFLLRELAENGIAIICYTTDMLETIGLCDQVMVLFEGKMTSILEGKEITEKNLMRTAVGKK